MSPTDPSIDTPITDPQARPIPEGDAAEAPTTEPTAPTAPETEPAPPVDEVAPPAE